MDNDWVVKDKFLHYFVSASLNAFLNADRKKALKMKPIKRFFGVFFVYLLINDYSRMWAWNLAYLLSAAQAVQPIPLQTD